MKDFFISYTKTDEGWAEWIAWLLIDSGYSVVIQASDFPPGANYVLEMHRGLAETEKTIVILSPDFLDSKFTQAEWAAVFAKDPKGEERKLVPFMVKECRPTGLLAPIVYVKLFRLTEDEAKSAVLGALSGPKPERNGPTPERKPYPGSTAQKPAFSFIADDLSTRKHLPKRPEDNIDFSTSAVASSISQKLQSLPVEFFNMIVYALAPPPGLVPPMPESQDKRSDALLAWAAGPSGPGLVAVSQLLDLISSKENVLLNELDHDNPVAKWLRSDTKGYSSYWLGVGIGALLIIISVLAKAHVNKAVLSHGATNVTLYFGYSAELNHGLFVLVVCPWLLYKGLTWLHSVPDAFRRLQAEQRLIAVSQPSVLEHVSVRNTSLFTRPLLIFIALVVFSMVFVPELFARRQPILGWVQSAFLPELQRQAAPLTLKDLKHSDQIREMPAVRDLWPGIPSGDIKVTISDGLLAGWQEALSWALFVFGLGWQAILYCFAIWLLLKIWMVFDILRRSLPRGQSYDGGPDARLHMELDYADKKERFGFAVLDDIYDVVLVLVLFTFVQNICSQLSNSAKGTGALPAPNIGFWIFATRWLIHIIPALALALVIVFPVVLFKRRIATVKSRWLDVLADKRATMVRKGADRAAVEENDEQMNMAERQTTWPKNDPKFWSLAILNGLCVGYLLLSLRIGGYAAEWIRSMQASIFG
jgi:hypothetical protein